MSRIQAPLLCVLLLASLTAAAAPAHAQGVGAWDARRAELAFVRERIYPSLVNIRVVSRDYQGGRAVRFPSAGSGTVISPAGHVLTNFHVTENATRITCTLPTGEEIEADLVGDDAPTDLSVLKLRLETRADPTKPLPFATLGDSDGLDVGDLVIAVGNPLALSSSMTMGIVSNTKRVFTDFRGTDISELEVGAGNKTGMFTRWIQHDALILPGNSGGPLCNLRGEIVGVNTRGGSGYGFASPSNLVRSVVNQILTFGRMRRAWVGVSLIPTEKIGMTTGVLVGSVAPGSPAAKAGLAPGDVVTALGGEPVGCRFFEELPLAYGRLAELPVGRAVEVAVQRDGAPLALTLTPAAMEEFLGEEAEYRDAGLTVQAITAPMALARQLDDREGVLVTGVRAGYPFESPKPDIRPGDIIRSLDRKPVKDLASFKELMAEAAERKEVAVTYLRGRESWVTLVTLDKKERSKRGGELPKAWLGVRTQVMTEDVAKAMGLAGTRGFRVTEVYPGTKAAAAGLQAGDVITAVDDEPFDSYRPQDAEDLRNEIERQSIGDTATFKVVRGGETIDVAVELEESPASATDAKKAKSKEFEFEVRDVTFMDRIEQRWPMDQAGVLVTEVTSGGWADMAGLANGDLVTAIDGRPVADVAAFEAVMKDVVAREPATVRVFVRRGIGTTYVFIEPDWPRKPSPR